jgi:hypothetical protein
MPTEGLTLLKYAKETQERIRMAIMANVAELCKFSKLIGMEFPHGERERDQNVKIELLSALIERAVIAMIAYSRCDGDQLFALQFIHEVSSKTKELVDEFEAELH